jgi:hypothetical protein
LPSVTTLSGTRLRTRDPLAAIGALALAAWAALVAAAWLRFVVVPGGKGGLQTLTFAVPSALTLIAVFRRELRQPLAFAAGAAWIVALAARTPPYFQNNAKVAVAIPVLVLAGLFAKRYPGASMAGMVAVAGTYGTLDAYSGFHTQTVADLFIAALWMAVLGRLFIARHALPIRPSPAFFLLFAYLLATVVGVLASTPLDRGVRGFRLAQFHLSAVMIIGYGGWRIRTLRGVGQAVAVVCLIVGAYATLRWSIGASAKERAVNESSDFLRQYNQTAPGEDKVQGSFPNGQHLGVWMACAIPFLVAMVLSWRDRFRLVALAALPLSVIGLLASEQRTGVPAALAGCFVVVVVHVLSRGFRGPRLGIAIGATLAVTVAAIVAYPAIANDEGKRARYANLLHPSEDLPWQQRLDKWSRVTRELSGHPFGFGIGTGDANAIPQRFVDISTLNIDNSYLMLAWDQGYAIMFLFVAAMLVLLAELLRFAVWTRGPGPAAYATAAAGTLTAILVEILPANRIDHLAILLGWVVVGLGVAQYGTRRNDDEAAAAA